MYSDSHDKVGYVSVEATSDWGWCFAGSGLGLILTIAFYLVAL